MDISWLATEARTLHEVFSSLFYILVLTALSLAIILEYFKLPLGGTPQFVTLVGRIFIAAILFVAILFCVFSALLWSFAVSDINKPEAGIDFLTAIIMNLMLAYSVVMTPKITASFLGAGISEVASSFGGLLQNAAALTPHGMATKLPGHLANFAKGTRNVYRGIKNASSKVKNNFAGRRPKRDPARNQAPPKTKQP